MLKISRVRMTSEMLPRVAETDEFKGAWRALGNLAQERLSALPEMAVPTACLEIGSWEPCRWTQPSVCGPAEPTEHFLANLTV